MKKTLLILAAGLLTSHMLDAQTYNYYFGNIHSQTSYSDGNTDSATSHINTPLQAFAYARASQHIDFYGISDHNHQAAGMRAPSYYHKGLADADSSNVDGTFVAMYGFEYGVIANGGHVIVYGSNNLIGWDYNDFDVFNGETDYLGLFAKVNKLPNAFAYLCHPQPGDYGGLVSSAAFSATADSAVVGACSRSGPAFSTNNTYSNPSGGDYIAQWRYGLAKGYHLGIGLDHDTHMSVYGRQTAGRLVVMATALTRANVYDAFRQRHFYSSDDWNAQATFTVNSQMMGSILTSAGNPAIHISVMDPDSESIASIQVFYGVPGSGVVSTLLNSNANSKTFDFTPVVPDGTSYYFYAQINQTDGDVIWTSPIWFTRNDFPADLPVAGMKTPPSLICTGTQIAFDDSSAHVPTTWSWSFPGSTIPTSNLKNPVVAYNTAGTYTVSLTATNVNGSNTTTKVIQVVASPAVPVVSQHWNTLFTTSALTYQWYLAGYIIPGATQQTYNSTQSGYYSVCVSNAAGCSTCSAQYSFTVGINEIDQTEEAIIIYPNPNDGNFTLRFELMKSQELNLQIFDLSGRAVYETKAVGISGTNLMNVDHANLAKGVYLLQFRTEEGMGIRKLVIN